MTSTDKTGGSPGVDAAGSEPSRQSSANLPVVYSPRRRRFIVDWLKEIFGLGGSEDVRASISDALEADVTGQDHLSAEERLMLRNVLELRHLRADDVMVPRADIVSVDLNTRLRDVLQEFQKAGHSRLPVVRESLDDPVGFVHIKDLLAFMTKAASIRRRSKKADAQSAQDLDLGKVDLTKTLAQAKLTRDVLYVPPSMPAGDLLAKMQATRLHMAIIVDEYGGTDGLATIEDLVEEIVGDIEDEHDNDDETMIRTAADGSLVVDARMPIEEISEETGIAFDAHEASDEIDTLGGLVFTLVGRIPVRGELIPYSENVELEVVDADPRRIKRLKIHRRSPKSGQLETAD